MPRKQSTFLFVALILSSSFAAALNRYVATTGADVGDCSNIVTPCLTVQYAINQSSSGDTVNIAAGTYAVAGLITVNKTLTFLGAQANVDARNPRGAESILSNTQGISVAASNCVFNGLSIEDSSNPSFTGFGLWINPGINGTQVINNIFQNNIVGLGLSNGGATQCLVQHNLFTDNNLAGVASGTGIYTNQLVSGAVSNVLINENNFINNDNAGIGFNSSDPAFPSSNITITNNLINNCGRGMYFFTLRTALVENNDITNLSLPTDLGSSVGIGVFGDVQNLTVTENDIENGPAYGISIAELLGASFPNSNILIHLNNIFGFSTDGMLVTTAPTGPVDYATCNWWGSTSGPTNALLNPTGTGDAVDGDLVRANFDPWLLGLAPDALCAAPPAISLNKTFAPDALCEGELSTLTIELNNPASEIATLTAPLVDNLPAGLVIAGTASNTCGGTLTAVIGSSTITLSDGSIPAQGSCFIKVKVEAEVGGFLVNTIPIGALQTNLGMNADPASAILFVILKEDPDWNRFCNCHEEEHREDFHEGTLSPGGGFMPLLPPPPPPPPPPVAIVPAPVPAAPLIAPAIEVTNVSPSERNKADSSLGSGNVESNPSSSGCSTSRTSDSLGFGFLMLALFYRRKIKNTVGFLHKA